MQRLAIFVLRRDPVAAIARRIGLPHGIAKPFIVKGFIQRPGDLRRPRHPGPRRKVKAAARRRCAHDRPRSRCDRGAADGSCCRDVKGRRFRHRGCGLRQHVPCAFARIEDADCFTCLGAHRTVTPAVVALAVGTRWLRKTTWIGSAS